MTANFAYCIATLSAWLGWGLIVYAGALILKCISRVAGFDNAKGLRNAAIYGGSGALFLLASATFTTDTKGSSAGVNVPLIWPVLPFLGWCAVVAISIATSRFLQAFGATEVDQKKQQIVTGVIWVAVAFVAGFFFSQNPEGTRILRGTLSLGWVSAVAITLLAVFSAAGVLLASNHYASRGVRTDLLKHALLLAGSLVFGLPFVWLLITSFKEDRDMVSPNGLVWIPKVQRSVDSLDAENPMHEGVKDGAVVRGTMVKVDEKGMATLNIEQPLSRGGQTLVAPKSALKLVPREAPIVSGSVNGIAFEAKVIKEQDNGKRLVTFLKPRELAGQKQEFKPGDLEPVRDIGLRTKNYSEALQYLPPETNYGLVYLKNTLIIVILNVIGTLLSSAFVAYAFSRLRFPGKKFLFGLLLSTMMLPAAVTLLPTFLIFRTVGWIDTLNPLWVTAFFASAFNVFLLRQFFLNIPMELEDAAKIDGCTYLKTFWSIMLPQIAPALAVIAIWTFMGAWNNFMGPLIYINSPENMPISYAVQLFNGERNAEPGLLAAFVTMAIFPVLLVFFLLQKYFIEGVTLSGLGGR